MAKRIKDPDKPHFLAQLAFRIVMVLGALFCVFNFISVQNSIVEKKQTLAQLEDDIEIVRAKNEELEDLIKTDDLGRYMEKLAVENNDYAYPDERRYYDTSRD